MWSILPFKQKPGNSQGMLSQEWAAIRTMFRLPDEEQEGPIEIDTEPSIELLCIVVAGSGVRVCHHVD